jgi:hypothetical protein
MVCAILSRFWDGAHAAEANAPANGSSAEMISTIKEAEGSFNHRLTIVFLLHRTMPDGMVNVYVQMGA